MTSRDRRAKVLASTTVNGIDFVEVANSAQTVLRVHFLNAVPVAALSGAPAITGGETIPTVAVLPVAAADWGWDDGHVVLTLRVAAPGDFSNYRLTLPSANIDPFFNRAEFSFKAGCKSDLDCETPPVPCPRPKGNAPPINYLAKDFLSFRQALLDFSTLRYPNWQERSEADFGVMFLEALSAVADELSYTQDRIAAEGTLLTATQRRSAQQHARLVDYEPAPPTCASTMVQFEVSSASTIPHGLAIIAPAPDGAAVIFETGLGLGDLSPPPPATRLWNRSAGIVGYWFDDSEQCLPAGATHMHVLGHGFGFVDDQMLLIETAPATPGDPPVRQIVHLLPANAPAGLSTNEIYDHLLPHPVTGAPPPTPVTRIAWIASEALKVARDLSQTTVIGNIANATQGRTVVERFAIRGPSPTTANSVPSAIERTGAQPLLSPGLLGNPPVIYFHTLDNAPLAWLPPSAIDPSGLPVPQIALSGLPPLGGSSETWTWTRRLLQASAFDKKFTVDPIAFRIIATNSDQSAQSDYDGDGGDSIRFGDGVFGANPDPGTQFTVTYRYGAGAAGNVAADAVSQLDPATAALGQFDAVSNPLAATGGTDAQTLKSVQRLAPQAFHTKRLRAVLADDYAAAADMLPWVKRAGTVFRWTGSWLTTFTTPEPVATEQIQPNDRVDLIDLLNRYRMAGTESYVPDPNYVSIDLIVQLCALPDAFAAQVKQAVTAALSLTGPNAGNAFFAVSRFVFGQPLQRSVLEAAIQAVPGVAGVTCVEYRLRDHSTGFVEMGDVVAVGANQIIRCDNDRSRPNNGALAVIVQGGR